MTSALTQQTVQQHDAVQAENAALREQVTQLKHQLDWFKRQLFGAKSEKRIDIDTSQQADLLAGLGVTPPPIDKPPTERITYERRKKQCDANTVNESGLRFDDSVPVETIEVPNPEFNNIPTDELEQIGEKISYRLAQRPGSYVILKYVRKVIKRKDTQTLHTAVMPANVLEKSVADVSFLVGILVDKFLYHLPLYRQHQRLRHSGITLSRATLTNLTRRAIDLLSPSWMRNWPIFYSAKYWPWMRRLSRRDDSKKVKCARVTYGRCMAIKMKSCSAIHRHASMVMLNPSSAMIIPAAC